MVFEKLPFKFDVEKLQDWHRRETPLYPITMRSIGVGGWAIQSSNGSVEDGWQLGFVPYNGPGNKSPSWLEETKLGDLPPMQMYNVPTPLCTGYMAEVINSIEAMGFHPRRARVILLKGNYAGQWHQDGSKNHYQVRLHIPIFSNEHCYFENENGKDRMLADGSCYLVHINQPHRVTNFGESDRYHLVINVWDTKQLSQFHRYQADI